MRHVGGQECGLLPHLHSSSLHSPTESRPAVHMQDGAVHSFVSHASVCKLDLENLAGTDRRCAITNVRDVERAVGSKGDSGRYDQNAALAVDEDSLFTIWQYANKTARSRLRTWIICRVRSFGSCCTAGARRYLPGKEAFRDWCHHAFSDRPSLILRCLDNVAGQVVEAASKQRIRRSETGTDVGSRVSSGGV